MSVAVTAGGRGACRVGMNLEDRNVVQSRRVLHEMNVVPGSRPRETFEHVLRLTGGGKSGCNECYGQMFARPQARAPAAEASSPVPSVPFANGPTAILDLGFSPTMS